MEIAGTSTEQASVLTEADPPAAVADDQKTEAPASGADDQNSEQDETPEQLEAKKESRRQRSNARKAAALAEARTEARILRERLEKLEAQSKPTQEIAEPKREDFQSDDEFLKAFIDHRADQRAEAKLKVERESQQGKEKQQQATAGQEKIAKAWAEREQSFQAATKDYEAVVTPFAEEELQSFSGQARHAIVESDVGPALLYYLAQNPDDAERIAELSPVRQIAELGKLEAKVSMPARKTTNAPPPANTTSGARTASKDPTKMDQAEYEAWRKANGARWAR